jgi:hypothetical protein
VFDVTCVDARALGNTLGVLAPQKPGGRLATLSLRKVFPGKRIPP